MDPVATLLRGPVYRAEELGQPLPNTVHAVSFALPCWQDVVEYEEKTERVSRKITSGYPRFVVHGLVAEVARRVAPGEKYALPFPSLKTANACADFIRRRCSEASRVISKDGMHVVATSSAGERTLRDFWQHTGVIVSSRQAEAWLAGRKPDAETQGILDSLRRQLAELYGCAPDDVYLAPTGMAAHFAALKAVTKRCPELITVQLGFPYVDTFKLQEKLGAGGKLLHDLGRLKQDLLALLERHELAACFCEIPGNPLLGSADLREITPILRRYDVPLIADDVVATPFNIDLSNHADLIPTSLTKFMAGTGDVMGGALICNPRSPLHAELKAIVARQHEELLWGEDARVLDHQLRTFPERMEQHNANGLYIAERLRAHPAVERVWYPKWEFSEAYEAVRRPEGGWGALITFLPRNAESMGPWIYDRLPISKGPSLGTIFSLACPFTLLAHYNELPWVEGCGVSRFLIRLSIGLEDPAELWQRMEDVLDKAAKR